MFCENSYLEYSMRDKMSLSQLGFVYDRNTHHCVSASATKPITQINYGRYQSPSFLQLYNLHKRESREWVDHPLGD